MSRRPIMAGNWKMNLLQADAKSLITGIKSVLHDISADQLPEVIVAPTSTSLAVVSDMLSDCKCGKIA